MDTEEIKRRHDRLEGAILAITTDSAAKAQLLDDVRILYEVAYVALHTKKH